MSSQNKRSINQIVKSEPKFIALFALVLLIPGIITQGVAIIDVIRLNSLGLLGIAQVALKMSEFNLLSSHALTIAMAIVSIGLLPLFASGVARKINGQSAREAVKDAFSDYSNKRTWNYVLKVIVPFVLVLILVSIIMAVLPNSIFYSLFDAMISNVLVAIVVSLIAIIIAVLIETILSYIVVGYIVYLRSDLEIKQALKAVNSKIINFLLGFNVVFVLGAVVIMLGFIMPLLFKSIYDVLMSATSTIMWLLIVLFIYQIIMCFFRVAVYVNAAENANIEEQLVIASTSSVQNPFENANKSNTTVANENNEVNRGAELTIKPKSAKHANSIKPVPTKTVVKRSIK